MNPNTRKLHDLGQRLWLDNITREMLASGTLARYIAELSVTGLTSNPTIFEHAIGSGDLYDEAIQKLAATFASSGETSSETHPSLPPLASKTGRNRSAACVRSCSASSKKMSSIEFKREGVDDEALAARLQREGVQAFAKSWSALMARIREKSSQPAAAAARARAA